MPSKIHTKMNRKLPPNHPYQKADGPPMSWCVVCGYEKEYHQPYWRNYFERKPKNAIPST